MESKLYYDNLQKQQILSYKKYAVCSDLLPNMQLCTDKILIDYKIPHSTDNIPINEIECVILWGSLYNELTAKALKFAVDNNLPIEIWENGFIRSIKGWGPNSPLTNGYSFIKDIIPYFDTINPLPNHIRNDIKKYKCSESDIKLAKQCITFITTHNLTKYNHQPLVSLPPHLSNLPLKLLLIDQSYNDMSVQKGQADEQSFIQMIKDALLEPDATLYLKLHPDTIAGQRGGYFKLPQIQSLVQSNPDRFILIDYESNPLHTIKQVDEVYCVTSQFGFEALMCNKPVHCYGQPIYTSVLNHSISIEEFFYIMYIKHTVWIDPYTNKQTDITTFLNNFLRFLHDNSI